MPRCLKPFTVCIKPAVEGGDGYCADHMPTPAPTYQRLYAYVAYVPQFSEWRIVNTRDRQGNFAPLVTGFERNLPRLRKIAQNYATMHKTPVRLLAFAYEEEVEVLQPIQGDRTPKPKFPLVRS